MDRCEQYQMNASAMMDGELQGDELTETIKHLAQCDVCMREYRSYQSLQQRVGLESNPPAVPSHLWNSISQRADIKPKAVFLPLRSRTFRILSMAAAFVLFFGLGYLLSRPRPVSAPVLDSNTPIVLASKPGEMTDARFVELTRELLSADPQYLQKMYVILHTLNTDYWGRNLETLPKTELPIPVRAVTADDDQSEEVFRF